MGGNEGLDGLRNLLEMNPMPVNAPPPYGAVNAASLEDMLRSMQSMEDPRRV
jgi:hypothetical protein